MGGENYWKREAEAHTREEECPSIRNRGHTGPIEYTRMSAGGSRGLDLDGEVDKIGILLNDLLDPRGLRELLAVVLKMNGDPGPVRVRGEK